MKYKSEILCLFLLALLFWNPKLEVPTASAHEPDECACEEVLACPPEGYVLIEIPPEPTNTQQALEDAMDAIERAEQALQKGPNP